MYQYYLDIKSSQNVSFLNYISVVFVLEFISEKCYNSKIPIRHLLCTQREVKI